MTDVKDGLYYSQNQFLDAEENTQSCVMLLASTQKGENARKTAIEDCRHFNIFPIVYTTKREIN